MLKKIIITSNKYSFCLDGYQKLANKYWGRDEDFTILAFQDPQAKLAKNYSLSMLGPGFKDSTSWSSALLPYFESLHDDFFFLCFEDHFLVSHVNTILMNEAEQIMAADESISKVRLLPEYKGYNIIEGEYASNFKILDANRCHNNKVSFSSLRPSIWRRSTFVNMLSSHRIDTPHDFERVNIKNAIHCSGKFLVPKGTFPLYPDLDVFRSGKPHDKIMMRGPVSGWWGKGNDSFVLSDEDKAVFMEAIDLYKANR